MVRRGLPSRAGDVQPGQQTPSVHIRQGPGVHPVERQQVEDHIGHRIGAPQSIHSRGVGRVHALDDTAEVRSALTVETDQLPIEDPLGHLLGQAGQFGKRCRQIPSAPTVDPDPAVSGLHDRPYPVPFVFEGPFRADG